MSVFEEEQRGQSGWNGEGEWKVLGEVRECMEVNHTGSFRADHTILLDHLNCSLPLRISTLSSGIMFILFIVIFPRD